MLTILRTNFIVKPAANESVQEVYARVKEVARDQITELVKRSDEGTILSWEPYTTWQSGDSSASLRWCEWQHSTQEGVAFTSGKLAYLFKQCPWEVTIKFGVDTESMPVSLEWRRAGGAENVYPLAAPPLLLRAFATTFQADSCYPTDSVGSFSLRQITAEDVPALYDNVINNPKRCIPVLLLAPTEDNEHVLTDTAALTQHLFGLALMYRFADDAAARAFRAIVGSKLACYPSTARVYWPDFNANDPAMKHDYWTPAQTNHLSSPQGRTSLFQRMAQASRRYFELPDALRQLEQQQEQDEQQQRQAQLARLQSEGAKIEDLEKTWQNFAKEYDDLKRENAELKRSNQELESLVQTLKDNRDVAQRYREELDAALSSAHDGPRLFLSTQAWDTYRAVASHQRGEFAQELEKLRTKPDLRRSHSKTISSKKTDCRIFPQGEKGVRIFFYEHADGSVRVCELGDHRDSSYEELINQRKVFRRDYPNDVFTEWDPFFDLPPVDQAAD